MATQSDQNKLTQRQKEAAERQASRMKSEGVGEDHANKLAAEEMARKKNTGGSNAGGEAKKPATGPPRRQRPGSDSNASK